MKILKFVPTSGRLHPSAVGEMTRGVDLLLTWDNPYEGERRKKNIQLNFEKMRRLVLSEGYDKVWVVEEDMIPPQDTLKKFLEVDAPVVTGLYCLRHGYPSSSVLGFVGDKPGKPIQWDDLKTVWGQTITVAGGCTGCVLIDRKVLEDFSFMLDNDSPPDGVFMSHCCEKGFVTKARLDVMCGHVREDGKILWPDKEHGWRVE